MMDKLIQWALGNRVLVIVAALIYAMLLSPDEVLRAKQLTELAKRAAPGFVETTAALWPEPPSNQHHA